MTIPDEMQKGFGCADILTTSYCEGTFHPEDRLLAEVRSRAQQAGMPPIHVGAMDGLHLEVLARAFGARKIVEIGTLAGYSAVCLSRALPADGFIHTFEFEPKHAAVAADTFKKAGITDRVKIHVGAALDKLPSINKEGPFDLVFIDADKVSYPAYLAWAAENLRVGGAVLADNTFAWGMIHKDPSRITDPEDRAAVDALRRFNKIVATDRRWRATALPTAEGLTLAVKIS